MRRARHHAARTLVAAQLPFLGSRALQFIGFIDALSPLQVLTLPHPDLEAAVRMLRRFPDQTLTLADALGIFLMDRHGCTSCWSTDFHLDLTGVALVIHQSH